MGDDERARKKEKERRRRTVWARAFLVVKISGIPDLRWLLALITFVISSTGVSL